MQTSNPRTQSAGFLIKIVAMMGIRARLLIRQKIGWISLIVGCGLVLLAMSTAQVSFVNPQKIFWDFSLGVNFVLQIALSLFLGSQLFHEERGRRTLHLILSSGVSRFQWLIGNVLGLWIVTSAMGWVWYLISAVASKLLLEEGGSVTSVQAMLLLNVETLIVLLLSVFFSLVVRQMLALALSSLLVLLLHSMSSIQSIFTNPQYGGLIGDDGVSVVLWLARILPPLEWLDLKVFVGYEPALDWTLVMQMGTLGILWIAVLLGFSWLRFEKMDL